MIEFISGKLESKQPHRLVISTGGVAFDINVPFSTFLQAGEEGCEIKILTHLNWREDGPHLFGFITHEERALFRLLTQVNKVGPKLAVNIMSATSPQKIVELIVTEDLSGLTSLKGVGPKLASRLIVELKDGIVKLGIPLTEGLDSSKKTQYRVPHEGEVREALENLGYSAKEIQKAFDQVAPGIPPEADLTIVLEAILRFFSP